MGRNRIPANVNQMPRERGALKLLIHPRQLESVPRQPVGAPVMIVRDTSRAEHGCQAARDRPEIHRLEVVRNALIRLIRIMIRIRQANMSL